MSASQDEIPPPPPPPPSSSQTPTQQTPHTVSTIKLPILKKGEYDIWAMKMEHYLAHTDYPIWEVIQNGNGPVSITIDTQGQIKVLPPRTAEEIMTDAKEMWDAIKSRFGGNDESKKMQKYILKQQFEGFSVSNIEGLHKGYDSSKCHDLNENEKVLQEDMYKAYNLMQKEEPVGFDKTKVECYNLPTKQGILLRECKSRELKIQEEDAWNSEQGWEQTGQKGGF
ncbi:hypothetical protein Tco_0452097 [Tanacetum coccineum]